MKCRVCDFSFCFTLTHLLNMLQNFERIMYAFFKKKSLKYLFNIKNLCFLIFVLIFCS